jgi:inner membrane protein
MASAIAHGVLAFSASKGLYPGQTKRLWISAVVCSILPDYDTVGYFYGIPYNSFLGHRGFTHSLPFALLLALVTVRFVFPAVTRLSGHWLKLLLFFFFVTASHGFLDAMTSGGLGVAFFSPFVLTRYFLPWRPLKVSPIGIFDFTPGQGRDVFVSELLWVILPSLALWGVAGAIWRFRKSRIDRSGAYHG